MPTRRKNLLVAAPLLAALVMILLSALGPSFESTTAVAQGKKKLSLRAMKKKMNGWTRMLKKKCIYCHVKDGDEFDYKATTHHKEVAAYCEENFVDQLLTKDKKKVTCATCHKGKDPMHLLPAKEKKSD